MGGRFFCTLDLRDCCLWEGGSLVLVLVLVQEGLGWVGALYWGAMVA